MVWVHNQITTVNVYPNLNIPFLMHSSNGCFTSGLYCVINKTSIRSPNLLINTVMDENIGVGMTGVFQSLNNTYIFTLFLPKYVLLAIFIKGIHFVAYE